MAGTTGGKNGIGGARAKGFQDFEIYHDNDKQTTNIPEYTPPALRGNNGKENVDPFAGFALSKLDQKKVDDRRAKDLLQQAQTEKQAPVGRKLSGDWRAEKSRKAQMAQSLAAKEAKDRRTSGYMKEHARQRRVEEPKLVVIGQEGVDDPSRAETKKNGVPFDEEQPGVIFWRSHLVPWTPGCGVQKGHERTLQDKRGKWYFDKGRFWIIVAREEDVVTEVPIFTYGNTGLENVKETKWVQYLNVKPKGAKNYVPQNPAAKTLEIAYVYGTRDMDRHTMVARVGTPQTREVDCDELEKCGMLSMASLNIIIDASKKRMGKRYTKK